MTLAYVASDKWDITNPNTSDIPFTWRILNTAYCGSGVASASATTRFTTRNLHPQTIVVTYTLTGSGSQSLTQTSP